MNINLVRLMVTAAVGLAATPALAQDAAGDVVAANGTTFRGIRLEADGGGDRYQSEGNHHDKLGYGGTVGFDGTLGSKFVVGAEASYWRPGSGNENCTGLTGGTVCHKAFEEWGAAIRAGYLLTPQVLVFGKAGYVNGEQRLAINGPMGAEQVYDHYRADGYQAGGGVEFTLTQGRAPIYVNAQYVYSNYHGNTARQRVMGGIGIRFK